MLACGHAIASLQLHSSIVTSDHYGAFWVVFSPFCTDPCGGPCRPLLSGTRAWAPDWRQTPVQLHRVCWQSRAGHGCHSHPDAQKRARGPRRRRSKKRIRLGIRAPSGWIKNASEQYETHLNRHWQAVDSTQKQRILLRIPWALFLNAFGPVFIRIDLSRLGYSLLPLALRCRLWGYCRCIGMRQYYCGGVAKCNSGCGCHIGLDCCDACLAAKLG